MCSHLCGPYCTPSLGVHAWTASASPGCLREDVITCSYYFNGGVAEVIDLRRCESYVPHPDDITVLSNGQRIELTAEERDSLYDGSRDAWLVLLWFPPWV